MNRLPSVARLQVQRIALLQTWATWPCSAPSSSHASYTRHLQHFSHFEPSCRRQASTFVSKHFQLGPGEAENFLRRHNLKIRTTETHALVEECPFCHPTRGKSDNLFKLYVKRNDGAFKCHRCNAAGSWFDLRRRLGRYEGLVETLDGAGRKSSRAAKGRGRDASASAARNLVQQQEKYVSNLWTLHGAARQYLQKDRGLSDECLKRYGVGAAHFVVMDEGEWKRHLCVTFPMYNGDGELVRHKIRSIETKSGMRLEPKGGEWGLFGLDVVLPDAEEVVITEGEFDAISVFQGTGRAAISLPNGASSLPNDLLPALERFKTVYLWMDNDAAGQDGASHFSRKLGLRRCKSVTDAECKDANDALRGKRDMGRILNGAKVVGHEALLTFDDMRSRVHSHLVSMGSNEGVKCQSIPGLNKLLGGLRQGELSIFSGHTGIGKTTMLSQLALDYCMQKVPTVWGSFEIPNERLIGRALRQFRGAHGDCANVLEDFDTWADRFAELPMYFMGYHGAEDVDVVIETMEYANYVYDCRHFVMDNLQFMTAGGGGTDRFERLDNAVGRLREFCTVRNVHVSLVVHPRKEEDREKIQTASVFGSAKATQEADNVIILQRGEQGTSYLDVRKNRFSGEVGQVALTFDRKRLLFVQDSAGRMGWAGARSKAHRNKCARAKQETQAVMRAKNGGGGGRAAPVDHNEKSWKDVVREHRAALHREQC